MNDNVTLEEFVARYVAEPKDVQRAALAAAVAVMNNESPESGNDRDAHDRLLTLREVSERLGLSVSTLRRLQIPSRALGRPRHVLVDVQRYLDSDACRRRLEELKEQRRAQRERSK